MCPVQNQKLDASELGNFLGKVAQESRVTFTPVSTGLTEGIDLGSNQFRALTPQKVAIIVGDGINSYDAGEIWHLFDTRYQMKITKLDVKNFNRFDLNKYTDIIVPNQYGALGKSAVEKLKTWVKNGGTLIGYRNTARWMESNKFLNKLNSPTLLISFMQEETIKKCEEQLVTNN